MHRFRLPQPLAFAHDGIRVVHYPAGEIETTDPELVRVALEHHGAELITEQTAADQDDEDQDDDVEGGDEVVALPNELLEGDGSGTALPEFDAASAAAQDLRDAESPTAAPIVQPTARRKRAAK